MRILFECILKLNPQYCALESGKGVNRTSVRDIPLTSVAPTAVQAGPGQVLRSYFYSYVVYFLARHVDSLLGLFILASLPVLGCLNPLMYRTLPSSPCSVHPRHPRQHSRANSCSDTGIPLAPTSSESPHRR